MSKNIMDLPLREIKFYQVIDAYGEKDNVIATTIDEKTIESLIDNQHNVSTSDDIKNLLLENNIPAGKISLDEIFLCF